MVDPVGDLVALGNAAAARAVHADRMDLVEIGERVVLVGEVADRVRSGRRRRPSNRRSRRRSAWARRDRSAASSSSRWARSLWRKTRFSQPELRMPAIIEAWLSSSEKMMQPGSSLAERRQRRLVRDVAGGEQQRRLPCRAGRPARPRARHDNGCCRRCCGCRPSRRRRRAAPLPSPRSPSGCWPMREIVVRAPDGDRLRAVMAGEAARVGEGALVAQDVDEHAIAPFGVQPLDRLPRRCGRSPMLRPRCARH